MSPFQLLFLLALTGLGACSFLGPPPFFSNVVDINTNGEQECQECEKVVSELKKIVQNPEQEKKLVDTLKEVCENPVMKPIKEQCLKRADYVVSLLHELQKVLGDPTTVCRSLKLCEAGNANMKFGLSIASDVLQIVKDESFDIGCSFCKKAAVIAGKLLGSKVSLGVVKTALTLVCKQLIEPERHAEQCSDKAISDLLASILPSLEETLNDPEAACVAVGYCQSNTASFVQSSTGIVDPISQPNLHRFLNKITATENALGLDLKCTACTVSVSGLLKLLSTDSAAGSIANGFSSAVCNLFPKTLHVGCADFMDIYAKTAVKLTLAEWSPRQICTSMKVCKSNTAQQMQPLAASPATCLACKAFSSLLAYELQQAPLQHEVISIVQNLCALRKGHVEQLRCESVAENYIPYMLTNSVALSLVPDMCPTLNLC